MTAAQLIHDARQAGVTLIVEDGSLKFTAPAGVMSDGLRARLKQHRAALIAIIIAEHHGLTVADLIEAAGADWPEVEHATEAIEALASIARCNKHRARGQRPPEYSEKAVCRDCGPIWLFPSDEPDGKWLARVLGCPWCYNRGAGLPIPRPVEVLCGECGHWQPDGINPEGGLGRCLAGVTVQGKALMPLRWHRSKCVRFAVARSERNYKNAHTP